MQVIDVLLEENKPDAAGNSISWSWAPEALAAANGSLTSPPAPPSSGPSGLDAAAPSSSSLLLADGTAAPAGGQLLRGQQHGAAAAAGLSTHTSSSWPASGAETPVPGGRTGGVGASPLAPKGGEAEGGGAAAAGEEAAGGMVEGLDEGSFASGTFMRMSSASSSSGALQLTAADVQRLSTYHQEVSILFTDIMGFTAMSQQLHPSQVRRCGVGGEGKGMAMGDVGEGAAMKFMMEAMEGRK